MDDIKFCQSCGMPLETSELIATNADGSPNDEYCIYCYKNGAFTQDCTMDEMIDISLSHMAAMLGDEFSEEPTRGHLEAFFPQLGRWKK